MLTAPSVPPAATFRGRAVLWAWPALYLILILAAIRAFMAWSGLSGFALFLLLGGLSAPFVLARYCWVGLIVPLTVGIACPGCARRPLRYVSCHSFGYRYYRCEHCQQRWKRQSCDEPWEDANGVADLPFYQPKPKFALPTRREWAWLGLFLGALLIWPALGAIGYGVAGIPGCAAGSAFSFYLLVPLQHHLVRRKEAAHRQQWRDAVDGLA